MSSFLLYALAQILWCLLSIFSLNYSPFSSGLSDVIGSSLSPLFYFLHFLSPPSPFLLLASLLVQLSFLFFHCYLQFIPPSPLTGDHSWDHVHCKCRGSICSGTSEDIREAALTGHRVTGSNHLPPHSIGAVSSGMSMSCSGVSFVTALLHSHGTTTFL